MSDLTDVWVERGDHVLYDVTAVVYHVGSGTMAQEREIKVLTRARVCVCFMYRIWENYIQKLRMQDSVFVMQGFAIR